MGWTMKITKLEAREILDSRGNPTVEVGLTLDNKFLGRATVPSGASTGEHEALELRDGDQSRYEGKGVLGAIANINGEIAQKIIDRDFDQSSLDQELIALDGTPNKSHLGANAILGVSLAFAHASAQSQNKELFGTILEDGGVADVRNRFSRSEMGFRTSASFSPLPMFNILNGGRHANFAVDWQEFMIVPVGATSFTEALAWGKAVWQALKEILAERGLSTELGDEGGFAPKLQRGIEALDLIIEAINRAGYQPGKQIALAIDVAASELKKGDDYEFRNEGKILTKDELINFYEELITKYPIISIEDGLAEDDWTGWQELTARLGTKINIVGDDLFVTNLARLQEGINKKVANAIIIKPNQIGTLSETLKVIKLAQEAGYKIIVSHRSGETLDTTIADLAVAVHADFIKSGAPSRPERLAKYDRLVTIEQKIKS